MTRLLFLVFVIAGYANANVNAVVSILPQKTFVKAIGGDKVNVSLMVKPGNSPHTYEPKPSQMKDISKADIYFTMGVEFENIWLDRFKNQNKTMQIVKLEHGIHKIKMAKHSHDNHQKEKHDEHTRLDPHIWTSPSNVKIIVKNILDALVKADNQNKAYYTNNYNKFVAKVNKTDHKIHELLNDSHDAKFMVFHPAWGYFAKQYHLEQIAVEVSGKSPKPKQIKHLIEEAKDENIKAIFTSPEFSDSISKQIANELGIKVIKVSPLNPKWSQNLINLAKAISGK